MLRAFQYNLKAKKKKTDRLQTRSTRLRGLLLRHATPLGRFRATQSGHPTSRRHSPTSKLSSKRRHRAAWQGQPLWRRKSALLQSFGQHRTMSWMPLASSRHTSRRWTGMQPSSGTFLNEFKPQLSRRSMLLAETDAN